MSSRQSDHPENPTNSRVLCFYRRSRQIDQRHSKPQACIVNPVTFSESESAWLQGRARRECLLPFQEP